MADVYDDAPLEIGSHNRDARRAAMKNGYDLPIIQVMLFPNGRVKVDAHKDVSQQQIREFLQTMIDKMTDD